MTKRLLRVIVSWCLVCSGVVACGGKATSHGPHDSKSDGGGDAGDDGGTNGFVVQALEDGPADKVDLLFMIDNSISMADKQAVLKDTVPSFVQRLVNPRCTKTSGETADASGPSAACPDGYEREFTPVRNIHVGVITSSLGGHGADVCSTQGATLIDEEADDHGHLIATRPRFQTEKAKPEYAGAQPPDPAGFLDWNPDASGGPQDISSFDKAFQTMVTAASEFGCGYESQLESIYHFLADPNPYARVVTQTCPGSINLCAYPTDVDNDLLQQRAAFLRPDSIVAVILLTDENDCSIQNTQQAYYVARSEISLPRATSACAANPNDPCCTSCVSPVPPGCDVDPTCATNATTPTDQDEPNLRCLQEKKRFGFDFLYPTKRYINALKAEKLCTSKADLSTDGTCEDGNGDGKPDLYPNPLYSDLTGAGALPRSPDRVFLAGIVGVPWQDIQATTDDAGKAYPPGDLHYKTAAQLDSDAVWDVILGNPNPGANRPPTPPTDALMLESTSPRSGNDGQGDPLAPPSAPVLANPVNSHEWGNTNQDDLMFSCVFRLPEPRDCAANALPSPRPDCDCTKIQEGDFDPLCQDPKTDQYGTSQFFAKAYPGLRELEVLRGFGENAVVASICARNLTDADRQDYGYGPATDALVDRMSAAFHGKCLPRAMDPDGDGHIPCHIVEVAPDPSYRCVPDRNRRPLDGPLADAIQAKLKAQQVCDTPATPSCDSFTACEILEAGPECHVAGPEPVPGYCYIDPTANAKDDPALVARCPASSKRILRFVDPETDQTPAPGAAVYVACAPQSI